MLRGHNVKIIYIIDCDSVYRRFGFCRSLCAINFTYLSPILPNHGVAENKPAAFSVSQNIPNPFNPTTTIGFTLAEAVQVNVAVYNTAGQKVDTLVDDFRESGKHSAVWDGSEFSAGVYFYMVRSGDFSKTMKMTFVR